MDEKHMPHRDVPYLVYEATQARNERTIKRLILVVIIAVALIFISNAIWLYAWIEAYPQSFFQQRSFLSSITRAFLGAQKKTTRSTLKLCLIRGNLGYS